ncbi:gastrula zinc finger protein XlCGF57.1, partial [Asbolus verrucosus]
QQLSETLNEQQTKEELQGQLHFPENIANVVIEEGITAEFVAYSENDETVVEVKHDLYTIETSTEVEQVEQVKTEQFRDQQQKLKYQCTKCDESFSLKVDLKVHMMSHPKDLDHVCHVCNKGFPESRILKRHLKIHLDKKPHQCDQCNMSFAESSNLSKHKKKHTGELRNITGKPHLCSVCGRAFKWASSLSKHMKYHTGHKLLSCDFCGKQYVEVSNNTPFLYLSVRKTKPSPKFTNPYKITYRGTAVYLRRSSSLKVHVRGHSVEKPFICKLCGKGFTQSVLFQQHLTSHATVDDKNQIAKIETVQVRELMNADESIHTLQVQTVASL